MSASGGSAGGSALGVAAELQLDVECVQRQITGMVAALRQLQVRQARFRVGAAGERRVVQLLVDLLASAWEILPDRRWQGTRRANLDVLLVGPGGVFVIDVKRWRDVRIVDGLLWHGDEVRYGDVAVLVPTNGAARNWRDVLRSAGVPVMLLADYDGTRQEAVKVGTFERSKALEFAHVLIPDSDAVPGQRRPHESEEAYAERAERERRRLFVAHTRARDGLWLGASPNVETTHPMPPVVSRAARQ